VRRESHEFYPCLETSRSRGSSNDARIAAPRDNLFQRKQMSVARGLTVGSSLWSNGESLGRASRATRVGGTPRRSRRAVRPSAFFGGFMKTKPAVKAPPEPSGTALDANAFKLAGVVLALPSVSAFDTEPVLEAFNLSHSDPSSFASVSDVQHFSNVVGTDCFAIIALCALYVLADAAENQRLDSATYQRLALAVVLYSCANVVGVVSAFAAGALSETRGVPAPSPAAVLGVFAALAPAGLASASAITKYGNGFAASFERVKRDWSAVTDLRSTTERGGYLERYLKLSFWASMIVGGAFAFSPLSPLAIVNEYTPSSQFIQRAFGLGTVFMLAPAQFVLLDAAQRGRLGGGTFKKLNLSIALAVAGIDAMTVYTFAAAQALNPDVDALREASGGIYNYVGALGVSFSILAVYLYQGVFAKNED